MGNKTQWLWRVLGGSSNSPAQRMHCLFIFAGACGLLLSVMVSCALQIIPIFHAIFLGAVAVLGFAAWWRARRGQNAQRLAWLMSALVVGVVLPVHWFFNYGIEGPGLLLYLLLAAYLLSTMRFTVTRRWLMAGGFVLIPALLVAAEGAGLVEIADYRAPQQKMADLFITYCICLVLLYVLMTGHRQRLLREKRRLRRFAARMREQARRDSLTGLLNHAAFHDHLDRCLERYRSGGKPVTLLLYDLDHFKSINDTHGHPYGDEVLRHFVALLQAVAHDQEIALGRYGGEEFCVLLCGEDMGADSFDRALRQRAERLPARHGVIAFSGGSVKVEISDHTAALFERADRALYRAKREGRNRLEKERRSATLCQPANDAASSA
ncbi:sensor domain-containing diguanylate cyclase [Kushneria aurantia]|uniref:diguanylate cyclase n=1 Tax=Kushneria aurantia TaxID=504092 RepID=A0ABV6G793_9GAMM|nr:GGDEF domain-containing protein [Kushneria aurantia]